MEQTDINYADALLLDRTNVMQSNEEAERDWHDIVNAFKSRSIISGVIDGVERLESGNHIVIVNYKNIRVVIPVTEMMIMVDETVFQDRGDADTRRIQILNNMMGAEIDFVIKGIVNEEHSAVASRKEAMLRKRRQFYVPASEGEEAMVHIGRIVEARIIGIAEKAVRLEVFGVEATVSSRNLTWEWVQSVSEKYSVGQHISALVTDLKVSSADDIELTLDVKSLQKNTSKENLDKCRKQGKYIGKITGIYNGVIFIRLNIGVNAIAHNCRDDRQPGKGDQISFVVTAIDNNKDVAIGIITKIIRQKI